MKSELGVIVAVIVLGLASIIFGILAFLNSGEINGQTPSDSLDAKVVERARKVKEVEGKIEDYRIKLAIYGEKLDRERENFELLKAERENIVKRYEERRVLKLAGEQFGGQAQQVAGEVSKLKGATLAAINKENSAERERMDAQVELSNKAKTEAQGRVLKIKEELTTDQKGHVAAMNYQKAQLADTKDILRDLTQREAVHAILHNDADGKVILSDPLRNFVSINLGTGMGVKNGFRFEVYTLLPGNKHKRKGFIEVRNAGPVQSDCLVVNRPIELPYDPGSGYVAEEPEEIISPMAQSGKKGASAEYMTATKTVMSGQNMMDPILEGDLIQNPFFNASRPLTFYVRKVDGETGGKNVIRYRWSEIKDAAERHGSKVVFTINTDVNYMIAQKNPTVDDAEFRAGVDLGIPIIYEWELFRFIDNK